MKLVIPPRYRDGFAALLASEDSRLRTLGQSIADSEPASTLRQLTERLAERTNIREDELADVLDAVASLYGLFADEGIEQRQLLSDLRDALSEEKENHPELDPDAGNWTSVRDFFSEVLRPDSPLAITAKAALLRMDVQGLYCKAKVLSDLRPIFKSDVEAPVALLPLHTLQLDFHLPDFELSTFSVTMTEHHLLDLRSTLDRAIRKHEQLRLFAKSSDIPFLDDEES